MRLKVFLIIYLSCFGLSSLAADLPANLQPGSIQQHEIDIQEQRDKESQLLMQKKEGGAEIDLEDLRYKNTVPLPDNSNKPMVFINSINTNPSSVLPEKELSDIKTKYTNKKMSIDDINAMLIEINDLYKKKNYITAKAILPPSNHQRRCFKY